MNIAFFTDNFFPQRDGVVTSVMNFSAELGKRGHSVMIIAPKPAKMHQNPFQTENVKISYVASVPAVLYPKYRFGMLMSKKSLSNLRSFRPDVVHFHTPWSLGFSAHLAAKAFDVPLIGTNHIYLTKENAQSLCIFPGSRLLEKQIAEVGILYIKAFYDACDLRLAPSTALIEGLLKSGYKKPFFLLPNGVPLASVRPLPAARKAALKKRYGLKSRVILHFGRLAKEKSVDDLLRAFALLRKNKNDVSLLIIGDGPMTVSLMRLSKKLKLEKDVIFAGSIAHDELISSGVIGVADCFATASKTENQPMAVLEAMSHSLPIVGVHEAGMVDLVTDNGLLAKPNDLSALANNMSHVLTHASEAKKMGASSRALAREFSIQKATDKLLGFYAKTVREKRRRPARA